MYGNVYSSPADPDETDNWRSHRSQATLELRRLSALLRSTAQTLKWYPLWEGLRFVNSQVDIKEVSSSLILLSNSCQIRSDLDQDFLHERLLAAVDAVKNIERRLKFPVVPDTTEIV